MEPTVGRSPKILFVNDFSPDSLNLADLSRQLLLGYPSDRLAWWYGRASGARPTPELTVCSLHHYRIPKKLVPGHTLAELKCSILERVWVPLAARHLRHTIDQVKPDLVWVLLYGWPILVARHARLQHGPPVHVSLWDFPDQISGTKVLGQARASRFVDAIFHLVRNARTCDGISRAMVDEIASQTGRKDAVLVHSGFEPRHLQALEALTENPADRAIRLAYVGTIISDKSFFTMLAALDTVRKTLDRPVMLEFYGGRDYQSRPWFNRDWMIEHGLFSDKDLVENLKRCSWGIVVMDPEGEDLRYSRFSFPNKIGTYLSAGVPVLGLGHPQSSLGEILQRYHVGQFTSARDSAGMQRFLEEALRLAEPRSRFRPDILACARSEFDAEAIRGRLWRTLGVV